MFSDRTSTHEFESNPLRLWFSSFAYVLIQALRLRALAHTELADAQCGTIRRKILKLGAQVRFSVRRIRVDFSSATPRPFFKSLINVSSSSLCRDRATSAVSRFP